MAGRLVSPPLGLPVMSMEPLSGPRVAGAATTQSTGGFIQTSGAAFGLWRWRFSFAPMHKSMFRRYRGWVTALHGGANATRWSFFDPDMMSPQEAGLNLPSHAIWTTRRYDQPWGNGLNWSNGQGWGITPPEVDVAQTSAADSTLIYLDSAFWGHELEVGDYLGFYPFHFGLYMVTQVLDDGAYRIWPPLRREVLAGDHATLKPVLAMRLESEEAASAGRGLVMAEGATVTMVEVLDYDCRDYFDDQDAA